MNRTYHNLPGIRQEGVDGSALHFVQGIALDRIADAVMLRGGNEKGLRLRAVAEFDEALRGNPRLWQAFQKKGEILEKLARYKEAARAYRNAWSLSETDGALRERLARAETQANPGTSKAFYRAIYERLDKVLGRKKKTSPALGVA